MNRTSQALLKHPLLSFLDPRQYNDPDAERAVLGLVLCKRRIPPSLDAVQPDHFGDPLHRALWTAARALHEQGQPIERNLLLIELDSDHPFDSETFDCLETLYDLTPALDLSDLYLSRLLHVYGKRTLWRLGVTFVRFLNEHARDELTAEEIRRRFIARLQDLDLATPFNPAATWADLDTLVGSVQWDWPGWLPRGFLILLAGEAGSGKSLLALRLAACYLCGAPWPDGTRPERSDAACILWCETETAQALNLQRARAWGLPRRRIWTPLQATQNVRLDRPGHRSAVARLAARPEVCLVVVDSLSGAGPAAECAAPASPIQWLSELARSTGKPVLVLHHLRKRGSAGANSVQLEHLRGHSSIVQSARVVLALDAPDLAAPHLKRLSVIKSNLAALPQPLGFYVDAGGKIHFCEAPRPLQPTTLLEQAVELLCELLADGPRPVPLILEGLAQAGISKSTARRAKTHLGISSIRHEQGWAWELPKIDAHTQPTLPPVAASEQPG